MAGNAKYPRRTIALGPPYDDGTIPGEPEREPTTAEVWETVKRYAQTVAAEMGGDNRNHDTHWARGAQFMIERADAYIADLLRATEGSARDGG